MNELERRVQRARSLAIHHQMKDAQAKRYRNRFTLGDGDYREQYEDRQRAEATMRRALTGG
ncbi:hypothetical protein LCGC14_1356720 [marine sediment metagenome]|uniref:Uncharacterized protein n=1 Tax=marine sediment metagenome TaxID=412755 RepID=A0A0F9KA14_9ZZZZ